MSEAELRCNHLQRAELPVPGDSWPDRDLEVLVFPTSDFVLGLRQTSSMRSHLKIPRMVAMKNDALPRRRARFGSLVPDDAAVNDRYRIAGT